MSYFIVGRYMGKRIFVESKPERCVLYGTMGDYGFTENPECALLLPRSKAEWHAKRVYCFDGHRGEAVFAGPYASVGHANKRNRILKVPHGQ